MPPQASSERARSSFSSSAFFYLEEMKSGWIVISSVMLHYSQQYSLAKLILVHLVHLVRGIWSGTCRSCVCTPSLSGAESRPTTQYYDQHSLCFHLPSLPFKNFCELAWNEQQLLDFFEQDSSQRLVHTQVHRNYINMRINRSSQTLLGKFYRLRVFR